jgi:hypothetical protein
MNQYEEQPPIPKVLKRKENRGGGHGKVKEIDSEKKVEVITQ